MDASIQSADELPEDEHSIRVIASASQWRGPLPPPDALEYFDRVIPGGAERILRMSEQQQAYRIKAQHDVIRAEMADSKRGHYLGFALAISAIAVAFATIYLTGSWQVAVAIVGVPVLAAARSFIHTRYVNE